MKANELQKWGIALLRVAVGSIAMAHGMQKLFVYGFQGTAGAFGQMGIPVPELSAALVIAAELGGGLLLVLGLFTRVAVLPLVVTMLVAILQVHLKNGFFIQTGGAEYAITLLFANLSLAISGGGALALDNVLARSKELNVMPARQVQMGA